MIKKRSFNLQLYTEMLARRAFLSNHDASLGIDDYKQVAALAVFRARKRFRKSRQVKFETYAVCIVKNSLITMLRRQRRSGYELPMDLVAVPDEDFMLRVKLFVHNCPGLSFNGKTLAQGLVGLWNLPTVSLTSLRKSLGMSKSEFNKACSELRTRFQETGV